MIKKILLTLAAVLPLSLLAQVPTGVWKNHTTFLGSQAINMIETPQKVYFLSSGAVSSFDKATSQMETFAKGSTLNDVSVTGIHYNYEHGYLLVTFVNSNINVLYDDGRVVTLSDLSDVVMNTKKGINDVTFSGDSVLIATEFGYMIVDDTQWRVTESRNFGRNVTSIAQVGSRLVLATEAGVMMSADPRRTFDGFADIPVEIPSARLRAIDDTRMFVLASGKIYKAQFNGDEADACDVTVLKSSTASNIQPSPTGWIINCRDAKLLYTVNAATLAVTQTSIPAGSLYSINPQGDGTPWIINDNGLYKQGTTAYYKPNAAELRSGYKTPLLWVTYNPESHKLYYQNSADNVLLSSIYNNQANINCYDGEQWSNVLPPEMRSLNLLDITRLTFVPGHPEVYFTSLRDNYSGGLCRVVNNSLNQIVCNNTPSASIPSGWPAEYGMIKYPVDMALAPKLGFDSKGNLWILTLRSTNNGKMACLPADKVLKDTLMSEDFVALKHNLMKGASFKHNSLAIGKGDVKVISNGNNSGVNYIRNPEDLSSCEVVQYWDWKMDNGTVFDPMTVECLYADRDGNVWMGTNDGVIYYDPSEAFGDEFVAHMPSIGTNPLLKGEQVNCVAQDSLGRMWFGTNSQGVVVTNSTGTEILAQFLGDNSDLPAMMIYDICVGDNSVFINTVSGLAEFDMNGESSGPAPVDYSRVSVAPEVIDPSYVGFVTINGLEDGSLVRVTRRDGSLVTELTSTGSTVYWDFLDAAGNRLPTGVYHIYAGADAASLPAAPQAEVRLIK